MITVTECTLTVTGEELLTILAGLHELPHKRVFALIAKIEAQIKEQHPEQS